MTGLDLAFLMPWIEPMAVVTGIASVALTVRQHIVSWPVGIASSALFGSASWGSWIRTHARFGSPPVDTSARPR